MRFVYQKERQGIHIWFEKKRLPVYVNRYKNDFTERGLFQKGLVGSISSRVTYTRVKWKMKHK